MDSVVSGGWMLRLVPVAALLLALTGPVAAQTVPGERRPPPVPGASGEIVRPPAAPARPPAESSQAIKFEVNEFRFAYNTLFDTATLAELVKDYLHRPLTVAELNSAADRITDWYVHQGYSLAVAFVPVQTLKNGVVRIEIFEGRISSLLALSQMYDPRKLERALLPLEKGRVYRASEMEGGLLRLNDLPGLHARALLSPGAEIGQSRVLVQTAEQRWNAQATVDSYGHKSLGRVRTAAGGAVNNPFGASDHIQLMAVRSTTGGLLYGFFGYDAGLFSPELRERISYGEARYTLSGALEGIKGRSRSATLAVDWTPVRSRAQQWTLSSGFNRVQSNTTFEGIPLPFDEAYNLIELSTRYIASPGSGAPLVAALTLASSGRKPDAGQADSVGLRAELDVQSHLEFAGHWNLYGRVDGVFSPDPLPTSAQFSIGGPYSVRGFPPGDRRGDRGFLGSLGFGYSGGQRLHWGTRIFADTGKATAAKPAPGDKNETLVSAGLGAGAAMGFGSVQCSLTVDLAKPVGSVKASDGSDDPQLFALLSVAY